MLKKYIVMAGAIAGAALSYGETEPCSITPTADGSMRCENSVIALEVSPQIGRDKGITSWRFLATDQDMIDRNREHKNILGEGWDSLAFNQIPAGMPFRHRDLYAPLAKGSAPDGAAVGIIQESKRDHRLRRTIVLRRDYSVVQVNWELENISGSTVGGAFRFFTAWYPGALTGTTHKNTSVFMPTDEAVLELDQNLHSTVYVEKYGGTKFFQRRWADEDEPLRRWVRRKLGTPFANDYWACEVNRNNGNGMFLIGDPDTLIGYYNCPRTTLETVTEAVALQPGETWQTSIRVGAFAIPKGMTVSAINPLFVSCGKEGVVPLFKGTLIIGQERYPAAPNQLITVNPEMLTDVTALDTQEKMLGTFTNGVCEMTPDQIEYVIPKKPRFWGKVYNPDNDDVEDFLEKRDFTVYTGFGNRRDVKERAREIALQLGVGLAYTNPGGKMLAIGSAADDAVVRNIGLMNNSVNDNWPGAGRGAVRVFPRLSFTGADALVIAGSDTAGLVRALDEFSEHLAKRKAPVGYELHVIPIQEKIYPHTRCSSDSTDKILIESARGEYESAQVMLTALSAQKNVRVSVSDLVHRETGEKMSNRYITAWRKRNGPVLVRWVDYYPFEPADGFSGYPDPLFERVESSIPAGESRAIWLTFVVPEAAQPGTYEATLTCTTGDETKIMPIEVNVWDFTIPREGLMGEAYAHLQGLPKWGKELRDHDIDIYVRNLVEHGMRFIHLTAIDMFGWHFSTEGEFQNLDIDWQEVSEDGKLMLDASVFDHIKERCDQAGKPFNLIYMIYEAHALYRAAMEFKRTFPERYEERSGHPVINSRYEEEMITLLRRHLERRGWLDQVYLKISDEPGNLSKWYNDLCQAAVGAGMPFFTAHGSSDLSTGTPEMSDIWQPIYGSYDDEFMRKAREAGKLISFYNCGPPPTTSVQAPASEWRSYLWQAAKLDLDIVAWWGIQCWSYYDGGEALWRDRYSHWNSVIYPEHPVKKAFYVKTGDNRGWKDRGMIDSIRWETIRDGMEDAWYINKLRSLIASTEKNGHKEEADAAEKALENIWENTYPDRRQYRPPFDEILENRRLLAQQILKLQRLESTPETEQQSMIRPRK